MRKVNGAFDSQAMGSYVSPIATMGLSITVSPIFALCTQVYRQPRKLGWRPALTPRTASTASLALYVASCVPHSNYGSIYHRLADIRTLQVKVNSRSTDPESKRCIRLAGHGFL